MTIYELRILMHYHCCVDEPREKQAPIWQDTVVRLFKLGLLVNDLSDEMRSFRLSDKGTAYVEALQRLPLPVQRWEIPCIKETV